MCVFLLQTKTPTKKNPRNCGIAHLCDLRVPTFSFPERRHFFRNDIPRMVNFYGTFNLHEWSICMANVGKYTYHRSSVWDQILDPHWRNLAQAGVTCGNKLDCLQRQLGFKKCFSQVSKGIRQEWWQFEFGGWDIKASPNSDVSQPMYDIWYMYAMESAGIFLGVQSDFVYLWWGWLKFIFHVYFLMIISKGRAWLGECTIHGLLGCMSGVVDNWILGALNVWLFVDLFQKSTNSIQQKRRLEELGFFVGRGQHLILSWLKKRSSKMMFPSQETDENGWCARELTL